MKQTEALIKSLIVEERRSVTPSLFPELEPADEDVAQAEDDTDRPSRQSLNRSVREILQAERNAGEKRSRKPRQKLLGRALGALRRKSADRDDLDRDL